MMTVSEILEQAKALSREECEELIDQLMAMQGTETSSEDNEWSEEELDNLLIVEPMTGAEIVAAGLTGGWADLDIETVSSPRQRRLSEPRGLGKEMWDGIDAQDYVNQLRDEWDKRP